MQKDSAIMVIIIAIIILAVAILGMYSMSRPAAADVVSVTTDKPLYHSNEVMQIEITVSSTAPEKDATIKIDGFTDSYGQTRLSHIMNASLSPGSNIFTYSYNLPPCSKCAGLEPGQYPVNVTLRKNGTPVSEKTIMIDLEQ